MPRSASSMRGAVGMLSSPGSNEVHLWSFPLAAAEQESAVLNESLSFGERKRRDRFHFERDRIAFMVGRGRLRQILARYLDTPPAQISFRYGTAGKPALESGELFFNLSHSGGFAMAAITTVAEVGVDLEFTGRQLDIASLAPTCLSPAEYEVWRTLDPRDRRPAFYACWTCKEALLKAIGDPRAFLFTEVEIGMRGSGPPTFLRPEVASRFGGQWRIHTLRPREGYRGAVAMSSREFSVCLYSLSSLSEFVRLCPPGSPEEEGQAAE